ncbi:MAG: DNA primase [Fervidobacterium sp.]
MIPKEIIEEIREKNDIVEIISDYVNIQKVGSNYRGLCPFHLETSPSFYVSPIRKMYHCFGCGASGDVIKFVQEIENISYFEAVKKLGERIGIKVSFSEEDEWKNLYYEFYSKLLEEYKKALWKSPNILDYLKSRGFSEREISLYEFGFSPPNSHLHHKISEKLGISKQELPKFGFSSTDLFSGRVIIPIKDDYKRVIAFGGRLVGDGVPKYINTQETIVFKKSSALFLIDQAKEYIKNADYVIICEGYFDALAFHRAGIKNAVATLGTSLTNQHIKKLKRLTSNFVLAFDNDTAGTKATLKSIETLLLENLNVAIINFQDAKDADETYKSKGSQGLLDLLEKAISTETYVVRRIAKEYDLTNVNGVNIFLKTLSNWYKIFSLNPLSSEKFVNEISQILKTSKENILSNLMNLVQADNTEKTKMTTPSLSSGTKSLKNYSDTSSKKLDMLQVNYKGNKSLVPTTEDYLVYIYFNYPDIFKTIDFTPDILEGKAREFFLIAKDLNVFPENLSKEMAQFVKNAIEKIDVDVDEKVISYIKKELAIRQIEKRISEIDNLIKTINSEDEKKILLRARIELIKQKEKIKRSPT